jgi:Na+/H+-dicarboxylate symporter
MRADYRGAPRRSKPGAFQPGQNPARVSPSGQLGGTVRSTLTTIIGMLLGIAVGYACHTLWPDPATAKTISDYISLMTDVLLRLIKMIIAPLVFSTLVVGVANMGDQKIVGRIGAKAMLWFVSASLVSLVLGLTLDLPMSPQLAEIFRVLGQPE